MTVVFVFSQHGETDMNQSGRIGGDGDLTARGRMVSRNTLETLLSGHLTSESQIINREDVSTVLS